MLSNRYHSLEMSLLAAAAGRVCPTYECAHGDVFGGERLVQLVVSTPNHEHLKYSDLLNMLEKIHFL